MFHSENLSAYAGTINKAVDELITNLSAVAKSGKEVNIFTQLGQMTMQVTGAAAFGYAFLVLAFLASWGHPPEFSMTQGSAEDKGHSTVETWHAIHFSNSRVQSVCIVACTVQHSMTKHACSGKAFAPK